MNNFEVFTPDAILMCHEVAERLRTSVQSIRDKVYRQKIPYFKIGMGKKASVRFLGSELNDWLMDSNQQLSGQKKRDKSFKKKKAVAAQASITEFNKFIAEIETGG